MLYDDNLDVPRHMPLIKARPSGPPNGPTTRRNFRGHPAGVTRDAMGSPRDFFAERAHSRVIAIATMTHLRDETLRPARLPLLRGLPKMPGARCYGFCASPGACARVKDNSLVGARPRNVETHAVKWCHQAGRRLARFAIMNDDVDQPTTISKVPASAPASMPSAGSSRMITLSRWR